MNPYSGIWLREWWLLRRRGASWGQPIILFGVIVTAFVLSAEAGADWLVAAAPAVVWVALLLALLVGHERAYRDDAACGFLQQVVRAPVPLAALMLVKMLAQWLFLAGPLLLVAPLALYSLGMSGDVLLVTWLALALGSPALSTLCALGSALTAGLPRAGVLLPLCVLPLCLPVMVFGAGASRAATLALSVDGPLYFLTFVSLLCLCLMPLVVAAAARLAAP